jgi:hypothetical protein
MTTRDDEWTELREQVRAIEESVQTRIRKLASVSTERMSEAELRARLETIRKLLAYSDGARGILDDCLDGKLQAEHASHVLETIRYEALALLGGEDE